MELTACLSRGEVAAAGFRSSGRLSSIGQLRLQLQLPTCSLLVPRRMRGRSLAVRAGMKDWRSSRGESSRSDDDGGDTMGFVMDPYARKRLENAWTVRQNQVPVACETCQAQGVKECEWCSGSGYFVLGDKMLCQVPSRNTSCLICHGHGSVRCQDCLGTGFRARWLENVLEEKKK